MKKLFTILAEVTAIMTIVSCQPNDHKEIRKAFKDYVKSDFDNPKDFVEIASIEPTDTIYNEKYLIPVNTVIAFYKECGLTPPQDLLDYKEQLTNDDTFIVIYTLKVRQKYNNRIKLERYQVSDNNGEYAVYEEAVKVDDAPELYSSVLKYLDQFMQ